MIKNQDILINIVYVLFINYILKIVLNCFQNVHLNIIYIATHNSQVIYIYCIQSAFWIIEQNTNFGNSVWIFDVHYSLILFYNIFSMNFDRVLIRNVYDLIFFRLWNYYNLCIQLERFTKIINLSITVIIWYIFRTVLSIQFIKVQFDIPSETSTLQLGAFGLRFKLNLEKTLSFLSKRNVV